MPQNSRIGVIYVSNQKNSINWDLVNSSIEEHGHLVYRKRFGDIRCIPDGTNFAPGVNINPKWKIPDRIVINTTINGGFFSQEQNPSIPIKPDEIYRSTREAILAGAPMVHVHTRDDQGYSSLDLDKMHMILDPIKEEFPDIVIDGCVVPARPGHFEMMCEMYKSGLLDATPINCTANYASDRVFVGHPHNIIEQCYIAQENNVQPELAVYTNGDVDNAYRYLIAPGLVEKPYTWCLLAGLPGGMPCSSPEMMISSLTNCVMRIREISDQRIVVCAAGRPSIYIATMAILMGLDIRIGKEDTLWKWPHKDDLITDTAACFQEYCQLARILGREPYTKPSDLRNALGMPQK